ncbi:MAG: nitroreductase family protein [Ktedonobacteraceae bacterium]
MSESTTGEASSRYLFEPLQYKRPYPDEALQHSRDFLASMRRRRSVRAFSADPVPFELIENAIATAMTAPSGANQQPWKFVVVQDQAIKQRMREMIETEEHAGYEHRFPPAWLSALAPLGTDWHKEFIEIAPYIIVVFKEDYGLKEAPALEDDEQAQEDVRIKHYYTNESVGIAVGFLIASLQQAGLAVLTHTPNPMGFLRDFLGRPRNEKPYVVLPVGYPAPNCRVPVLHKKRLDEVMIVL